jgi:hypothetical protein
LGFSVISGHTHPLITSAEMDDCTTATEAFEIAKRVRKAMVGAASVDEAFRLGSVIDFDADPPSRHALLEIHSATHKVSSQHVTLRLGPPEGLDEHELASWKEQQAEEEYQVALEGQRAKLEPAYRNEKAEKVLELLAVQQPSGEILYKIYELAEGHPSNRAAFQVRFAISRTEFDRFKDAVHNPTVTGDWARHAYEDPPKSAAPMSKGEAQEFIRRLAARWLDDVRRSQ